MRNPAAFPPPRNQLNEFTTLLLDGIHMVQLRNGTYVKVTFDPAEDEFCTDGFKSVDGNFRFNMDGTSITSHDFDIISNE